jgi:hypothetical protein
MAARRTIGIAADKLIELPLGLATEFKVSSGFGGFPGSRGSLGNGITSPFGGPRYLGTAARDATVADRNPTSRQTKEKKITAYPVEL